jgi:hypothetical protein
VTDTLNLAFDFDAPVPEQAKTALAIMDTSITVAGTAVEALACDWTTFLMETGSVPLITDERKPWTYKGWLMWYRLLCEEHPDVPKRWEHWFATMSAGKLLDEPIPQIQFSSTYNGEGTKVIDKCVRLIDAHYGSWSSVGKLMEWLLWGFGLSDSLPDLGDKLHEQLYRTFNLGPLLLKPADYLGQWIAEQRSNGWNPTGFFPTPHEVCEMMCQMNFQDGQDHRSKTVCDPALGTGRMLLHASNYSYRLYGNDIDNTVLMGCKINGALYAPWMIRPFPESYFA